VGWGRMVGKYTKACSPIRDLPDLPRQLETGLSGGSSLEGSYA
jgi:hypothetical protein